jgi:hypothetical protein
MPNRFLAVNLDRVKADISRFIPDPKMLDIWSSGYFHDLAGHLKIKKPDERSG